MVNEFPPLAEVISDVDARCSIVWRTATEQGGGPW